MKYPVFEKEEMVFLSRAVIGIILLAHIDVFNIPGTIDPEMKEAAVSYMHSPEFAPALGIAGEIKGELSQFSYAFEVKMFQFHGAPFMCPAHLFIYGKEMFDPGRRLSFLAEPRKFP